MALTFTRRADRRFHAATQSYWQGQAGMTSMPAAAPPREAEFVIIGGGLAGLSTAIRIAEARPGADVVVLEANRIGWGASGRNGGLMSPLPAPVWLLSARSNPDHAWALRRLNEEVHGTGRWLAAELPESEAQPATLRLEAMGRFTSAALTTIAGTLDAGAIAHRLVDEPRRGRNRALEIGGHTVHPYKLVAALAARATRLGVRIHERSPVKAIVEATSGALLALGEGHCLRARTVVVCTNGYTGSVVMPAKARAKVVHNYMVATERLGDDLIQRLGKSDWFTVELNKAYVFYRLHEGRLLFGGIEKLFQSGGGDFDVPRTVLAGLEQLLARSVPGGGSIRIAEAWGGRFHCTSTDLPIITRTPASPAIVLNVGYGGTGVALTLACSRLAAAVALGNRFADPADARLLNIMRATRLPLSGALRALGSVAWQTAKSAMHPMRSTPTGH